MYESLADNPRRPFDEIETFSPDDAPTLLYGANPTTGIVALEPAGWYEIELFIRSRNGRLRVERHVTRPWIIVRSSHDVPNKADTHIEELRGPHPWRFLVSFETFDSWRAAPIQDMLRSSRAIAPRSLTAQFQMRTGTALFRNMVYSDVRRLQLDIETTSLEPNDSKAEVIMIALKQGVFEDVLVNEGDERDLLERLNAAIKRLDPDVIEGHNIYRFDIPYLIHRARILGIPLTWGRNQSPPRLGDDVRNNAVAWVHGRHVIDTYQQIQRFDIAGNLARYGLKDVIRDLGLQREERTFVPGDDIAAMWERGEHDHLLAYALDDVRDVESLSEVIMPNQFFQTQMLPMTYQQAATGGTGRKIDDLMLRSYLAAHYSLPSPQRSRPFPGGYVELVRKGRYERVVKCDVESLYPSIMIRESTASATDVLKVFPVLLTDLRKRRIEAKRNAQQTSGRERATWQGLQGGFKILINSFFGYLGFQRGTFNDYDQAERITLEGRRLIQEVVRLLEARGAKPLEIDTDGVYFVLPDDVDLNDAKEFVSAISAELPEGIDLAHDGSFTSMLSIKQKTYALLDEDDNVTLTGSALRSRTLEPVFQNLIREIATALLHGESDKARDIYFETSDSLRSSELRVDAISQFIRLRESTMGSKPRLQRLLESQSGGWEYGERVEVYERSDGELGFSSDYQDDANVTYLLRRAKDVVERFRPAIDDDATFDALFPAVTPRTDLELAREREPVRQLDLFS